MELNHIYQGDSLEILKTLPDSSVDCCITSPPYYGLRDYGTGTWVGGDPECPHRRMNKFSVNTVTGHAQPELRGMVGDGIYKTVCPLCGAVREDRQVGLEETPEEYVNRLVIVFREVKRVLKDTGTLWLNIGDSYAGGAGRWGKDKGLSEKQSTNEGSLSAIIPKKWKHDVIKPKDLMGIPWMLAFALRADGWYLRQDIIWHKPNPMPESVRDRCTKSHEYIFLLSKSSKYYFDNVSIKEPAVSTDHNVRDRDNTRLNNTPGRSKMKGLKTNHYTERNKRDVWTVTTKPFKGAHFATFPEDLIEPCVLAGCKAQGIVLDPFFGSGTTGVVSLKNNRNYIGIELNPEYISLASERLSLCLPKE